MPRLLPGVRTTGGGIDEDGYREFTVIQLVECGLGEGPFAIMNMPDLFQTGDAYNITDIEFDEWAFCWPYMKISIHEEKEGENLQVNGTPWRVEQQFKSKPFKRCSEASVTDPLLEPQKCSGSFVNYTREMFQDRFGNLIKSSSHEPLRGQQVEFDDGKATVHIEQNMASLELPLMTSLRNNVNASPLWGLPPRCIKLSGQTWERKYYGQCSVYYTRAFDFDIDFNTFDRFVIDEGTKLLNGHWKKAANEIDITDTWVLDKINGQLPNPNNPTHFKRAIDRDGNALKFLLNGGGIPLTDINNPFFFKIEYYPEADLLQLAIPTEF